MDLLGANSSTTVLTSAVVMETMDAPEAPASTAILLHLALLTFLLLLILIGVTGNALSLVVYHFRWPHSTFTVCVRFLAVVDFLNLSLAMSLVAVSLLQTEESEVLCRLTHGLSYACNSSTGIIVAVIAVQRYRKVVTPWKRAIPVRMALVLCFVAVFAAAQASVPYAMTFTLRNFTVTLDPNATVALRVCHPEGMAIPSLWSLVSLSVSGLGLVTVNVILFLAYTAIGVSVVRRRRARARAMMMMSPLLSKPKALRVMVSSAMILEDAAISRALAASIGSHAAVRRTSKAVLTQMDTRKKLTESPLTKNANREEAKTEDVGQGTQTASNRNVPASSRFFPSFSKGRRPPAERPATISVGVVPEENSGSNQREPLGKKRSASLFSLPTDSQDFAQTSRARKGYFNTFPWKAPRGRRFSDVAYGSTSSSSSSSSPGTGRIRRFSSLQALKMLYQRSGSSSQTRRRPRNRSEIFPDGDDITAPKLLRYEVFNVDEGSFPRIADTAEEDHVSPTENVTKTSSLESLTSEESLAMGSSCNDVTSGGSEGQRREGETALLKKAADTRRQGARGRSGRMGCLHFGSELDTNVDYDESSSVSTSFSDVNDASFDLIPDGEQPTSFKPLEGDPFQAQSHSALETTRPQISDALKRCSEPLSLDRRRLVLESSPLLMTVVESSSEQAGAGKPVSYDATKTASFEDHSGSATGQKGANRVPSSRGDSEKPSEDLSMAGDEGPAVKRRKKSKSCPVPQTPTAVVHLTSQSTKMCFVLTLVYLLSYIPYCAILALSYDPDFGHGLTPAQFGLFEIGFFFLNINNTVNPIIYGLMSKKFRDECLVCWMCVKKAFSRCPRCWGKAT